MQFELGLIVVVGAIILVLRLRHSRKSSGPAQTTSKTQPPSPWGRRPSTQPSLGQPSRFDEKTAKHLHHKRILKGSAYITDGDTIKIKNVQIRLFGIDAPELDHPYGKKAKWALHKLCKGHVIRAEITDQDKYGRTVAQCFLSDGRDLSAEMVKQGLAIDWPKFSGGKYRHLEPSDARKKLFLADARQNGRMHVWKKFEAKSERP